MQGYEIYQTTYQAWTWRSGNWYDWDFRKGGEFDNAAAAMQDAIEQERSAEQANEGAPAC